MKRYKLFFKMTWIKKIIIIKRLHKKNLEKFLVYNFELIIFWKKNYLVNNDDNL